LAKEKKEKINNMKKKNKKGKKMCLKRGTISSMEFFFKKNL